MRSVAILTSPDQWFVPYAESLANDLGRVPIYYRHEDLDRDFDILLILSYHRLLPCNVRSKNAFNVVIHESDLPAGKGWAPLFWQILAGQNEITFTMFEASDGVDDGIVYMKRKLILNGTELNAEIRAKQANLIIEMCQDFIIATESYLPGVAQVGEESFYPRRSASDSLLDPAKSIRDQFNLLRIVDNEAYPAYFEMNGEIYTLTIEKETA